MGNERHEDVMDDGEVVRDGGQGADDIGEGAAKGGLGGIEEGLEVGGELVGVVGVRRWRWDVREWDVVEVEEVHGAVVRCPTMDAKAGLADVGGRGGVVDGDAAFDD